jgi:hypothetical protein
MLVRLKRVTDRATSWSGKPAFPEKQILIGKGECSRFPWSLARTIRPNHQNVSADGELESSESCCDTRPAAWLGNLEGSFLLLNHFLFFSLYRLSSPFSPLSFGLCHINRQVCSSSVSSQCVSVGYDLLIHPQRRGGMAPRHYPQASVDWNSGLAG